jgi:hypothetical protein
LVVLSALMRVVQSAAVMAAMLASWSVDMRV